MVQAPDQLNAKVRLNPETGELEKEVQLMNEWGQTAVIWEKLAGEELENMTQKVAEIRRQYQAMGGDINAGLGVLQMQQWLNEQQVAAIKKAAEDAKKAESERIAAAIKAAEEEQAIKKATAAAEEELETLKYHATHSRLENELYDIERKKKKEIENKVSEAVATELAEARKAEAIKRYNEEIEHINQDLRDKLFKLNHDATENKLYEIDREVQALRAKGADEVLIEQWINAEKRKLQIDNQKAVDDARGKVLQAQRQLNETIENERKQSIERVKSYISSTYSDEIEAVKRAIKSGGDIDKAFEVAHRRAEAERQALQNAQDYVAGRVNVPLNINEPGQKNIENAQKQYIDAMKELTEAMKALEKAGGPKKSSQAEVNVSVPVTINVNSPEDKIRYQEIADKVAAIIQKPIVVAIQGGDEYGY